MEYGWLTKGILLLNLSSDPNFLSLFSSLFPFPFPSSQKIDRNEIFPMKYYHWPHLCLPSPMTDNSTCYCSDIVRHVIVIIFFTNGSHYSRILYF